MLYSSPLPCEPGLTGFGFRLTGDELVTLRPLSFAILPIWLVALAVIVSVVISHLANKNAYRVVSVE
jgi:hypothetical protein